MNRPRVIALALVALPGCSLLFDPVEQAVIAIDASNGESVDASIDAGPYALHVAWQQPTGAMTGLIDIGPNGIPALAGHFNGLVTLDTKEFMPKGGFDVFVGHLDPDTGEFLDAASFGDDGTEVVTSFSVADDNHMVLGGGLSNGDTTLGGEVFDASGANPSIGFVARYDTQLAHVWSLPFASDVSNASVNGLSAESGPLFVSGGYAGELTMTQNGGAGLPLPGLDSLASYYGKYNPNGTFSGGQTAFSGMGDERCELVVADGLGSAYIAGFFSQEIVFDPPIGTVLSEANGTDFFIGRIGHNLNLHWVISLSGNIFNLPVMKGALGEGNRLVLVSEFSGEMNIVDLDAILRNDSADADIALLIFDPEVGEVTQAHSFPSLGTDRANDVSVGPNGEIAMVGRFTGTINFGGEDLISLGGNDAFVAVFDAAGAHLWSQSYGTSGSDTALSGAFDSSGSLYLTVRHQEGIDFGLGPLSGTGAGVIVKFER